MFSELILLGLLCILTELKDNQFFKRRKDEKDNFNSDGHSIVIIN